MKMLKSSIAILCLAAVACKKPKETATPVPSHVTAYESYSGLKAGNYWVYEKYYHNIDIDSSSATNVFDSCYIEKDTTINGKQYFKYCRQGLNSPAPESTRFLRDSLHYIVDNSGSVLFSSEDFTTVFKTEAFGPNLATPDTMTVQWKMTVKDGLLVLPAGTFKASAFSSVFIYQPWMQKPNQLVSTWYTKNVGIVQWDEGFYFMQPDVHYEMRLLRYHLQ